MKIPSILNIKRRKQPWRQYWPSRKSPETRSFRARHDEDVFAKYHDHDPHEDYKQPSFDHRTAVMITGVRSSDRLFFEENETSSILREKELRDVNGVSWPFDGAVARKLESMQEMVEEQLGLVILKDDGINWECLEELLGWYLRMNLKINHGFIIQAFVDLLLELPSN